MIPSSCFLHKIGFFPISFFFQFQLFRCLHIFSFHFHLVTLLLVFGSFVELNFDDVYDSIMVEDDIVVVENVDVIDDKFACDANAQT